MWTTRAAVCENLATGLVRVDEEWVFYDGGLEKDAVHVKCKCAGVNFGELLQLRGQYQEKLEPPFVPGNEVSGIVEAVGSEVKRVKPGDVVVALPRGGGWARDVVVKDTQVMPLPVVGDFAEASALAVAYGTAHMALVERAKVRSGETVLVTAAAGGVGLAAVELGKAMGAHVIAAASSAETLAAARAAGADAGINYSDEPLKAKVKELTGGRGADVIYDPVGGDYSEQALRGIAWNGRHLVIGFAAGDIPKLPLNLTLLKSCSVVGVFWGTWTQKDPAASAANFGQIGAWLADGTLKPRVKRFALDDFADALAEIDGRRAVGKLVLTMPNSGL
ncbi:MAG: NADPH:quinone oxidoreductase family protein [Acidobacteriota bacterium]